MSEAAYQKAMAQRLAAQQHKQRSMSPLKVGQKLLRDFCGAQGFGAVMPPDMAADLVRRIEAIVIAERAPAPPQDSGNR